MKTMTPHCRLAPRRRLDSQQGCRRSRETNRLSLKWRGALAFASFVLVVMLCSQYIEASAAPSTTIHGTVTNGATHHVVGKVQVELYTQRAGKTQAVARAQADAHGRFTLAVPALSGNSYTVAATYKGVRYAASADTHHLSKPLALTVYDTTQADTNLVAPLVQIGMTRTSQGLQVAEEWTVVNPSQSTDVGSDAAGHAAAIFIVPAGATGLKVLPGSGSLTAPAAVDHGAVVMNTIIRPATGMDASSFHQVKFAFTLPKSAGHPTLTIPTRYLIGSLEVFALHSTLVAPGFTKSTIDIGSQSIPGWKRQSVAPNTTVRIGVDGPPAAAAPATPAAPAGPAAFPLASVAILIGGGFIVLLLMGLSRRAPRPVPATDGAVSRQAPDNEQRLRRDRDRLIEAIAALDLQHAHGRVSPKQYERRRAREKGRLIELARRIGD